MQHFIFTYYYSYHKLFEYINSKPGLHICDCNLGAMSG